MPTYNDDKYITLTLDSIFNQEYSNYEILICDDGSTDDTKNVVDNYKSKYDKDNKITYVYQDNADQLNALIALIPYITGDYVYILHSDDLFYDNNTLSKMVEYMENNKDIDSIMGDLTIIDKNGKTINTMEVDNYCKSKNTIILQLLWLGRNLYTDMAFHKKEVFVKNVYNNYLLWNGPFWLNLDDNTMLNVKKVDFSFFKYRVFDDNYLSNILGNLNVLNGEIRVVTRLLCSYSIPGYKIQYYIYRVFNKLHLAKYFKAFYINKESNNKYRIIKFVLNKRITDKEIEDNLFLNSLLLFYKNNTNRTIELNNLDKIDLYYGKDMKIFNKNIVNNSIDDFYKNVLLEMQKGFNEIVIHDRKDYNKVVDLMKFLCIYPFVKVRVKEEK